MEEIDAASVRAWVERCLVMVVDGANAVAYYELTARAAAAVDEVGADGFRAAVSAGGDKLEPYRVAVGEAVVDWLRETIERDAQGVPQALLVELLDLGDSQQVRMFGDHYLQAVE